MPVRVACYLLLLASAGGISPSVAAGPEIAPTAQRVDQLLGQDLQHSPEDLAPIAGDATFLRRVHLDLIGDIPTPEVVTGFLIDPAPNKRAKMVRQLLADPQYGQNWARYWRDVVMYRRVEERGQLAANSFTSLLTEKLNAGQGWDAIATEMITASGDISQVGSTALIAAQDGQTEEVTAEVSRIFLGIQLQCAQCHDHPWDSWQREQFHELAAFFPRLAVRPINTPVRRSFEVVTSDRPARRPGGNAANRPQPEHWMPDLEDPQAPGTRMQPKFFLTGAELKFGTPDAKRRSQAAEWITQSPWFSHALVNRIWAELVGEPLFETVDDIGPEREVKSAAALAELSAGFVSSGHDLKWLLATIAGTDAYQRESRRRRTPDAKPMTANVAQRLRGDQLYSALLTSLEIDEQGRRARLAQSTGQRFQRGARSAFNAAFGFDPSVQREAVAASIPQALALMNTPQINNAVKARRGSMLGELLREVTDDKAVIDDLYLRCLSRLPTEAEQQAALEFRRSVVNRAAAYEDLLWSLLNSAEFAHRR